MDDLTADDVAAMWEQGDFRAYLRSVSLPTRQPETAPAPEPERDPDRPPGAWPAGAHPPSPPPPIPGADWGAALDHYRQWAGEADRTEDQTHYRCDCGACPREGT